MFDDEAELGDTLRGEAQEAAEAEAEREWQAREAEAREEGSARAGEKEARRNPQYVEDMGEGARTALEAAPLLRIFARRRWMEHDQSWTAPEEGGTAARIDMEAAERRKIDVHKSRDLLRLLLALAESYGDFVACYAVDGSHEGAVGNDGHEGATATAWGVWDGARARGGALPGGTSIYRAELHAARMALKAEGNRRREGGRTGNVLVLSDCQP
jgi:hypothetical protein